MRLAEREKLVSALAMKLYIAVKGTSERELYESVKVADMIVERVQMNTGAADGVRWGVGGLIVLLVMSWVVMKAWNGPMVESFGWQEITYGGSFAMTWAIRFLFGWRA